MKMRKKLLSLSILVLLTIGMLSALDLGPVGVSAAADYPSVYVKPDVTLDPTAIPDTNYTIEIWTDYSDGESINGDNITAFQFSLTWNPLILEGLEIVDDGFVGEWWGGWPIHIFVPGTFDNTAGSLSATYLYYVDSGEYDKNGPGKLATVTFGVVGLGDSDIILGSDTYLLGWNNATKLTWKIVNGITMPFHLGHGTFANLVANHDVAITSVTTSATEVVQGEHVTIDVDVENQGEASETFDVTVWTGILELSTQTVTDLAPAANTTLTFDWDTTTSAATTYTISAIASTVAGEEDTADNALTGGDVTVDSAIVAVIDAPDAVEYGTSVHFNGTGSYSVGATIDSYFWDLGEPHTGQPTTATTPEVDHTYKWPGVYGISLIVTDDLNRTSIEDYHTITIYLPRAATLVKWQAKPETKQWHESLDDDGLVGITALARNTGSYPVNVELQIAILDASGNEAGPPIVVPGYGTVTDEAVGVGDGTTTVFSLDNTPVIPGTETIYVKGVVQTRDTDYSIDYTTGTITFTTAPKNNRRITADYEYGYPSISLPVGVDVPIEALLDPHDYGYDGSAKVVLRVNVTLRYDSDGTGTPDTDAPTKTFRFVVGP